MAGDPQDSQSRFYFTPEQLADSPSHKCGMEADTELQYRQRAANLIQDMGQRLHVSQLCINTAIVYMHRFYAFHSFTDFHRNSIAAAALFLAAKVEEQPRKLEHVIKVSHLCLNQEPPDPTKEPYQELAQDLVFNENVLLQTLGFDVAIDHPHTHVVKTCGLVKASKELAQTSYFMASNSLHLTTMCLQYRPTVVACFCIHLACKWSRWEIPQSTEGKHWFQYVDKTVTLDLLKQLTDEFLHIFDKCPTRLKRLKTLNNSTQQAAEEQRKAKEEEQAAAGGSSSTSMSSSSGSSQHHKSHHSHHSSSKLPSLDHQKSSSSRMSSSSSSSSSSQMQQQQQQRVKMDRPSVTSHSTAYPTGDKNLMSGGSHMRPPVSSRDSHFNKNRPHSMGSSGQVQQSGSMKDRHSTGNGQQMTSHMKHEGSKMMKIHPTNIGVNSNQMDPTMRKSGYPSQGHKLPPGYTQNNLQKHKSMPPHGTMKQQNHSKHHQSSSQPQMQQQQQQQPQPPHSQIMPQMPPPPPSSQSFKLLDESVITDTTLKTSPTHSQKPSSIFSPDWKDPTSIPMPPLTQTLSSSHTSSLQQQQQQQRTSSSQSNRNNNTSQHNLFNKPMVDTKKPPQIHSSSQPPPLIGIGMSSSDLDFLKQEKLSNEPPQQLLATKDMRGDMMKSSSHPDLKSMNKRPPSSLDEERDFKMRRLEARMEGSDTIPELTAIKQEEMKSSSSNSSDKWQQQQQQQQQQYQLQKRQEEIQRMQQEQMKRESDKWAKGARREMYQGMPGMQQPPPMNTFNDTQSMVASQNVPQPLPPSMIPPLSDATKPKPLPNVNGIETNPDVIRNLLKESLVSSSLASSHATILPISDTPGPLLSDSAADYSSMMTSASLESQGMTTPATADITDSSHHRKSEKKKKKEKHKHKEKSKDKDKDREERKKHKKDKDRHRDKSRDRDHGSSHHHPQQMQNQQQMQQQPLDTSMKITIPKNKISLDVTNAAAAAIPSNSSAANIGAPNNTPLSGGLKIKIPKDRIKPSTGNSMPSTNPGSNDQAGIKIKICRNAIEGYKQQ